MDEQELIAGCRRKDPSFQKMLYNTYAPKMMSVCYRYVTDKDTAQDLLQDGFLKVFTKIGTYTGEGSFAGWIRRIFVTTSLEYLRRHALMKFTCPLDDYDSQIEDDGNASALSRLTAEELLALIAKLPAGCRTVFNLYAIEGYSHSEIAGMLKIKESSSQSQLVRARKMLQRTIEPIIGEAYARQKVQ
ncbi:MAG: RNA polymerase sigma factor [Bacteroidota bacterium]|nr:RNA polymerase sigma factor [Bacteroidota bacterium]